MKHKTWFRLLLKAIGVFMVLNSIPSVLSQVAGIVINIVSSVSAPQPGLGGGGFWVQWTWWLPQLFWWAAQIGIGCYLFFGGRWIVDRAIPSNRPYCPDCGYDLSRNTTAHCPECGIVLPRAQGGSP